MKGDLGKLERWRDLEHSAISKLEKRLLGIHPAHAVDASAFQTPLTRSNIDSAFRMMVRELGLPDAWVHPPTFAIRSFVNYRDPNPPEPLILNSFYLQDLATAQNLLRDSRPTENLIRYLGAKPPIIRKNLLDDQVGLQDAVAPRLTPNAKWPSGESSLVLLQQAAVNIACARTSTSDLIGINGPPGTGKTTLLRDIVANVVCERAVAMCEFDDPESAFKNSGERLRAGNGWIHLYNLDAKLRGYEMVVASTNNKAVENVSSELPSISSVANEGLDLDYFGATASNINGKDCWGLIAAVLGNSRNRAAFKSKFWWDVDFGLNVYLQAVQGLDVGIEEKDEGTGEVTLRQPLIVNREAPPTSHSEALLRWKSAKSRFAKAYADVQQWQEWLESVRALLDERKRLVVAVNDARMRLQAAALTAEALKSEIEAAVEKCEKAAVESSLSEKRLNQLKLTRPGFFARLFNTKSAQIWSRNLKESIADYEQSKALMKRSSAEHSRMEAEYRDSVLAMDHVNSEWIDNSEKLKSAEDRIEEARSKYGVILVDDEFFAQPARALQLSTAWYPPQARKLREELFVASVKVHRAFVDAAAKPLRHNLGALMNVFTTQVLPDADKQCLLVDLWVSLFLVVPLVSTTFASVQRMFGMLPFESIGWLLVDEAGQATPQAMIGALLRSKRCIVVGDPIQIQPVVTLPETLVQTIIRRAGVDPNVFAAPAASVQTLADSGSAYVAEIPTSEGARTVGVPLLVHRRCAEPMFSVANRIAYGGLMVQAKRAKHSPIRDLLGPSGWFHVEGRAEEKWCPEEGEKVIELLGRLRSASVTPDLYIVSPFVQVAEGLRRSISECHALSGWVEDLPGWVRERVGTVHTVQGREAEAVLLVLGAPDRSQAGARAWAGWPPNLLNVALTRAKEALYVIGNRSHWQDCGCFKQLAAAFAAEQS